MRGFFGMDQTSVSQNKESVVSNFDSRYGLHFGIKKAIYQRSLL